MKLTEHFTSEELCFSSTAQRLGIDNTPSQDILLHLKTLALGLERIRAFLKAPMHIDSGYRCPSLNKAVGGAISSAHLDGYAADFTCAAFGTPLQIVQEIVASSLIFDQCIQEGTWVHISFARALRRKVLTAHFSANGTTYTEGLTT